MKQPMSPCKGCTTETGRRVSPNCHDSCEKFLAFRRELEAWNADQKKRRRTDVMVKDVLCTRKERFK